MINLIRHVKVEVASYTKGSGEDAIRRVLHMHGTDYVHTTPSSTSHTHPTPHISVQASLAS